MIESLPNKVPASHRGGLTLVKSAKQTFRNEEKKGTCFHQSWDLLSTQSTIIPFNST